MPQSHKVTPRIKGLLRYFAQHLAWRQKSCDENLFRHPLYVLKTYEIPYHKSSSVTTQQVFKFHILLIVDGVTNLRNLVEEILGEIHFSDFFHNATNRYKRLPQNNQEYSWHNVSLTWLYRSKSSTPKTLISIPYLCIVIRDGGGTADRMIASTDWSPVPKTQNHVSAIPTLINPVRTVQ